MIIRKRSSDIVNQYAARGSWEILNGSLRGHLQNIYKPTVVKLFLTKRLPFFPRVKDFFFLIYAPSYGLEKKK